MSWQKQISDKPLFADLLWSRPENKRSAGKLLVVGGNSHAFNLVSLAYNSSLEAGVGTARIVLPATLEKPLGRMLAEAEFAAATPSGSFARESLDLLLDAAEWADGVLLAGDFGKNSETAILLESFIQKYQGQLTLVGDSSDYFFQNSQLVLDRENTVIVAEFSQLQRLLGGKLLLKSSMDWIQIVTALSAQPIMASLITKHEDQVLVVAEQRLSSTQSSASLQAIASYASVWSLQQPSKPFQALTTAVYCASQT